MISPVVWNCSEISFFLKLFWTRLQFIAAPPAAVAAAVLGPGWGLYCTVEIMEFASSLFLPLDYSVSMDTWLQFPLQSANQRLKTGCRSIAVLWCLYPSRHCFIFVSSSSIVQRRSTASAFLFLYLKVSSFYCRLVLHRPALECHTHTISVRGAGERVFLWRELRWKQPSGVLAPESKLAAVKPSRDPLKAKLTHP